VPYFLGRTVAELPTMFMILILPIIPYFLSGLARVTSAFLWYCLIFILIILGSQRWVAAEWSRSTVPHRALLHGCRGCTQSSCSRFMCLKTRDEPLMLLVYGSVGYLASSFSANPIIGLALGEYWLGHATALELHTSCASRYPESV
jgi:hypothetical protein